MVGAKSGDTERQLLKNLEHNQLSVKPFLNIHPGRHYFQLLQMLTRALNATVTVPFTHCTGLGKWGRNQEL